MQRRLPEPQRPTPLKQMAAVAPSLLARRSQRTLNLMDRWRLHLALLGFDSGSSPVPASGISTPI